MHSAIRNTLGDLFDTDVVFESGFRPCNSHFVSCFNFVENISWTEFNNGS